MAKDLLTSDSESSDYESESSQLNGTDLKVNEDYARKFEYQNRLQERQRCKRRPDRLPEHR